MMCKHYRNGECTQTCGCAGNMAECDYTSDIVDASGGSYKFLLSKAMELIEEFREHMTCSLPCIYCKKYDSGKICDGKFEWIYEQKIKSEVGGRYNDQCSTTGR